MALKHLLSGTPEISVAYFSGMLQPLRFEDLGFQKTQLSEQIKTWWCHLPLCVDPDPTFITVHSEKLG